MNATKKSIATVAASLTLAVPALAACSSDADIAARNLGTAAEQFEIERRIVFVNGITDKYLLEITGRCSVETSNSTLGNALEVTCKDGPDSYKKHFLGLSDNVTYVVEQVDSVDASAYNYRVIFKPEQIVPDIDLQVSE